MTHKTVLDKIFIANDSLLGIDIALGKAAVIEHFSGAVIEVAEVIYDTVAEEPPEVLPRDQQAMLIEGLKAAERNALERLVAPYRDRVASVQQRVIWNKQAATGIVGALDGVDLLIKPVSQHKHVVDRLHAPLDWALMRQAPCPVLVSKRDWVATSVLVAAVDVADSEHAALNREILVIANQLAQILGAGLHVVSAYSSLGQQTGELQVAMDFEGIKADMRAAREAAATRLIEELDLRVAELHLVEGRPGAVIANLANRLGATITVLGTAARRGLSQLLMGNTAEHIISALEGDVLTVREQTA